MKTAGVVENSEHCIYSIGLKCFLNCLSLFHLVFYLLQSNMQYLVNHSERFLYNYIYSDIYDIEHFVSAVFFHCNYYGDIYKYMSYVCS